MALITRVARLFRADLHAVLDRLEEPETLLRQALRDMEEAQGRDEQRLKLLDQALAQAVTRAADLRETLDAAEAQLSASLQAGQDDLARAVIRRRLEADHAIKALARRRAELEAAHTELAARVREDRSHLEAMRQKVEVLAEPDSVAHPSRPWEDFGMGAHVTVQAADVELALLAAKQSRPVTGPVTGPMPGKVQP
jgi:phage shock protein A